MTSNDSTAHKALMTSPLVCERPRLLPVAFFVRAFPFRRNRNGALSCFDAFSLREPANPLRSKDALVDFGRALQRRFQFLEREVRAARDLQDRRFTAGTK